MTLTADRPVHLQLQWLIDGFVADHPFEIADVAQHFTDSFMQIVSAEQITTVLNDMWTDIAPVTVEQVVDFSVGRATLSLVGTNGVRWRFNCATETGDPPLIAFLGTRADTTSEHGVTIRDATMADSEALSDLEREARWVLGDIVLTTDRRGDYFALNQLLGDTAVVVAERGGVIVGALSAVSSTVLVDGVGRRGLCIEHARVHPDHQGLGIALELSERLFEKYWAEDMELMYCYVHPDNAHSQRVVSRAMNRWALRPVAASLTDDDADRPADARRAVDDDIERIAEILNTHHGAEVLWSPLSGRILRDRLARSATSYSLDDIWINGDAVVGTWSAGAIATVSRSGPTGTTEHRDAVVLDLGYLPGSEQAFADLLRWRASELRARGLTGLVAFTSPGCTSYEVIRELASDLHPVELFSQPLQEPPSAPSTGIYVDPLAIAAQTFGAG